METRGQNQVLWLRKCRSLTHLTKVGITLSVLSRSSCSSWTTSEDALWSGNLRSMRWKTSRQWPYLSSQQLDCLSSPPSSVWSTFWLRVSKGEPQPSWRLMLSGSMSWFLAYFFSSLTFNNTDPVWWGQISGGRFGRAGQEQAKNCAHFQQVPTECGGRVKIANQRDGGSFVLLWKLKLQGGYC